MEDFCRRKLHFESMELPTNFVIYNSLEKVFDFSCMGFEKQNMFILDVLYQFAIQPNEDHRPMEEFFQDQLKRYVLRKIIIINIDIYHNGNTMNSMKKKKIFNS